ncbi:MAG: glycosyltransferase family 4 protein [Nitrososphaera sp.]|nr:glycosyltransferase family 4 protein [Nitrososphaera sp.]
MKILFVNRFFFPDHSATSQLLSDLCFHLAEKGFDAHVVTSRQLYEDPNAEFSAEEDVRGAKVHRVWTSRFGRANLLLRAVDYLTFYLSAGCKLLFIASRGDVIVAKTDPPLISVLAWLVAKLKGATLINWLQDLYPEVAIALNVRGMNRLNGVLRSLRNLSLRYAKWNVVLGERMAQLLEGEGIDRNKIAIIHNWNVGDGIVPVEKEYNELRREWGLDGKFVVGYSGNMGRAHDFETIIGAAKLLNKQDSNIVFLFIGGGAKQSFIETESAHLSNVICKPYQPLERLSLTLGIANVHLVSLLPEMEGMIVPSKFYGIAAAERPSMFVGDPEGEIARIVRKEDCGYVVATGGATVLADGIIEASKNDAENARKGRNARNAFERRFNKNVAMASWGALLK